MISFNQFLVEQELSMDRWKQYLSENPMLKAAVEILGILEGMGGTAYIVGGAVRDIVLGDDPHDIDIATNVSIDKISNRFKVHDIGASRDFGIVVVNHGGFSFEIANFRKDGVYSDGRKPESVEIVMDFKTDASRRDLTINSMGIDKDGNIIDHFDGLSDIKNKVIRTVGNPDDRFEEDKLRILRMARFASKLDFDIDPKTADAASKAAPAIKGLSSERIRDELFKTAGYGGSQLAKFISDLDRMNILEKFLPEISEMKDFEHTVGSHPEGGVFLHTLAALKSSTSNDPIINLGILFHDVGKIKTRSYNEEGVVQYLKHALKSDDLVKEIGKRLRFSNEQIKMLSFAVLNHMKFHEFMKMSNSKLWNMISNDDFGILAAVAKADWMARGNLFRKEQWDEVMAKVEDVKSRMTPTEFDRLKKLINGNEIMSMTGLKPGKALGILMRDALEWAVDNSITTSDEIYAYIGRRHKDAEKQGQED